MLRFEDIQNAHERINPYIHRTPILTNSSLNKETSTKIYFKCENFQKSGSFKIRGATNAVMCLKDEDVKKGIITASSGNHGAALSMAVSRLGGKTTVVMPKNTPKIKVQNVKRNGGEVIWCDPTQDSREATLRKMQRATESILIHPYNNENIIAGQGTAAKELLEECPDLDIIISPVSGGGLLAGTIISANELKNDICVFGAEPQEADDAYRSIKAGHIKSNKTTNTICDGLRAQMGSLTFPIIKDKVSGIITLSENDIIIAMRTIWERLKIIVEPSCSIALAAVIKRQDLVKNKKVGLIMSGGNVDLYSLPW